MDYTKEDLTLWLKRELIDLVKDIERVEKSDMPEFNKGLERVCAFDAKVAKILEKLATPDLYEACKSAYAWYYEGQTGDYKAIGEYLRQALAKAEDK